MPKAYLPLILAFALADSATALTLDLPAKVLGQETRSEIPGSYALPIATTYGLQQ